MAELDLTKIQVEAYLKHEEEKSPDGVYAYAGEAQHYNRCPLAQAYKFYHPKAQVAFNTEFADVGGRRLEYRHWQKYLIDEVDTLGEGEYATVGYVRSLLAYR